jgi:hypothetical protein
MLLLLTTYLLLKLTDSSYNVAEKHTLKTVEIMKAFFKYQLL